MWLKLLHSCTWTCYEGCQATPRGRSVLCRQQVKVTCRQSRTGSKIIPIRWSIIIVIFFFFLYLCLSLSAIVKYYNILNYKHLSPYLSVFNNYCKVIWTQYMYMYILSLILFFSPSVIFSLLPFLLHLSLFLSFFFFHSLQKNCWIIDFLETNFHEF